MAERLQQLRQQLGAPDSEARLTAVKQLPGLPHFSMELFVLALGDADWRVRKAAVEGFLLLEHPENLCAELIELLHHQENVGLRNAVIETLVGLGPLASAELQREVSCSDPQVRKYVIDIIGAMGENGFSAELVGALTDTDNNVRYAAVEALGQLGNESAILPLLGLLEETDVGLRFTALQALASIGGALPVAPLIPLIEDRLLRKAVFDCFGQIGRQEAIPYLVEGLTDPMRHVRDAALLALSALAACGQVEIRRRLAEVDPAPVALYLEELLAAEDPPLRAAALSIYGMIATGRQLHLLLDCVADERLRDQALAAFSTLGENAYLQLVGSLDPPVGSQLLALIFVGTELGFSMALKLAIGAVAAADPEVRQAAALTLGRMGGEEQLEPLVALLKDEDPVTADAAAEALAHLGLRYPVLTRRQIEPLLEENDSVSRLYAVRIMGRIDRQGCEGQLLKACRDSSSRVRCEAIRRISGQLSKTVSAGLMLSLNDESPEARRLAVVALGQSLQGNVCRALERVVADEDPWVRAAVMRALGNFGADEVRQSLFLGLADSVGLVVIAALESVVKLLPGDARSCLEQALSHQDEEVVMAAMDLMAQGYGKCWIEGCSAVLLNHSHWDVRAHAATALGLSGLSPALRLLEDRLVVEGEELVRQVIDRAIVDLISVRGEGA